MGKQIIITINPQFNYMEDFIRQIPQSFNIKGTTIYKARNEIKVTKWGKECVNIKKYHTPNLYNAFVYSYIKKTKAERAYSYAMMLQKNSIPTPTPIAYIICKQNGCIRDSYLITCQSTLKRNFYEFGYGGIQQKENIIREFAYFTANLHEKGIYHKDYSPGNILFDTDNNQIAFEIIDINRMKFSNQKIDIKHGCRNFARLWGNKDFFRILAQYYAEARNANTEKCIKWVLQARNKFWKRRNHSFYEYE